MNIPDNENRPTAYACYVATKPEFSLGCNEKWCRSLTLASNREIKCQLPNSGQVYSVDRFSEVGHSEYVISRRLKVKSPIKPNLCKC